MSEPTIMNGNSELRKSIENDLITFEKLAYQRGWNDALNHIIASVPTKKPRKHRVHAFAAQVLERLGHGLTYKQTAAELGVSRNVVAGIASRARV